MAFMTGALDDESTHANDTRADLVRLGVPTALTILPDAPHSFLSRQHDFDRCLETSEAFFSRHLKSKPTSVSIITDQQDAKIFPVSWRGGKIAAVAAPLPAELRESTKSIVSKALSVYPDEVLQKHLAQVYVVGGLRYSGVKAGGTRSAKAVYLVAGGIYTPERITRIFHAEFSSILFRNHAADFDDKAWLAALPEGFAYRGSGVKSIQTGKASQQPDGNAMKLGFIHQNGQSSKEEDFNSFAARLLVGDSVLWKAVERHPMMKAKANLVMSFYERVHPAFTNEFFAKLRPAT